MWDLELFCHYFFFNCISLYPCPCVCFLDIWRGLRLRSKVSLYPVLAVDSLKAAAAVIPFVIIVTNVNVMSVYFKVTLAGCEWLLLIAKSG